jgi:hypothetical protein
VESTETEDQKWWSLVSSMAELHQWELENHPMLLSLTGSPDVLVEEKRQGTASFYRVRVTVTGKEFSGSKADAIRLRPGLTATVEIKALDRTVLSYLTKPITKTLTQSLGER